MGDLILNMITISPRIMMMGNKAQTTNKEERIDLFLKEKGTDLFN